MYSRPSEGLKLVSEQWKQYSVFAYENEGKRAATRLSLTGLVCVQVVDQVKFTAPHFN